MKEDFNNVLKATIKARWDEIRDAMLKFSYFDDWDDVAIRECCILSKIKCYDPNTIILGDDVDQGNQDLVYFVIEGSCVMIEHLFVKETIRGGRVYYEPYTDPIPEESSSEEMQSTRSVTSVHSTSSASTNKSNVELHSLHSVADGTHCHRHVKSKDYSVFKLQPTKITVAQNKLRLPPNVKLRFMQVRFSRCFYNI